jgi:hypothetical protein
MVFQRFSIVSLRFLLLLTGASAMFVYFVSPLRDPTFQPSSVNAGSLVWWLQGVPEENWVWGASILAGLLAINFTLVLWQWYHSGTILAGNWHQNRAEKITLFIQFTCLSYMIGLLLRYVFMLYLLGLWMID